MYYPIQIPHILNKEFSDNITYTEEIHPEFNGFAICLWTMQSLSEYKLSVKNIIVADGCIDLVVDFHKREIGFAGMSKTDFDFVIELPERSMGIRMMPGAFWQLTGLVASEAMDTFLEIGKVFPEFDQNSFFDLSFEKAKGYLKEFFAEKAKEKEPDEFTSLFHILSKNSLDTASELYKKLHCSSRQCQRLFAKHYGITPKMVLSIVRFQKCLEVLTGENTRAIDILNITNYYDQPHFINDFKQNIGLTPLELIQAYRS